MPDAKRRRLALRKLFSIFTFEVSLFLLFKLVEDYEKGWFADPSTGEAIILVGLFVIAINLGWISFNFKIKHPSYNFLETVLYQKFNFLFTSLLLIIICLSALVFLSSRIGVPVPLRILLKHKDLLAFFLLLCTQLLIEILISRFSIVKKVFTIFTAFANRHALLIIFIVLVGIKILLLIPIVRGLLVLRDTYLYWVMAKQILYGSLDVAQFHHYPPLFSIILSPVLQFGLRDSLRNMTIFNVVLSSTAIFPLYLIAREFLTKKFSLLFVLVCASFPFHIVYPAILFSENLYYPLFFWTVYFALSYPKSYKQTWLWDALLGLSLAAMWLTRYMTWPLIPIFILVWWLKNKDNAYNLQFKPYREKNLRLLMILALIFILNGIWIISGMMNGVDFKAMLGFPPGIAGNPDRLSPSRLLLWVGISAAYLSLILSPVMNIFVQYFISWKKIKWNGQLARWFLLVIGICGMLLAEATRHAWRAPYNYPDPTKFVGRYVLYISAFAWLSAIILLREKIKINKWILFGSGGFSALATYIGYQLFYDQNWILKDFILNFRFVDVFSISYLRCIYLCVIGILIFVSAILIAKQSYTSTSVFLLCGLLCLNIVVWPSYLKTLMFFETNARHLDEMLSNINTSHVSQDEIPTMFVPKGGNFYEEELEVRGYDPNQFIIEQMTKNPMRKYNCMTRLMIQYPNETRIAVIDQSTDCKLPSSNVISLYSYNQKEYQLVEISSK